MTIWMLPGFSCRGLVAVLVKYIEDEAERRWLFRLSAMIPRILPRQGNLRNSCDIVRIKLSI